MLFYKLLLNRTEYLKLWYLKNRDKRLKQSKKWYIKNREKELEQRKQRYIKNREKEINQCKEYQESHKDECKQYRENNKEKRNEYSRNYYQNNRADWHKYKEKNRQYSKEHPEIALKSQIKYMKKLGKSFDMTSTEYSYALNAWSKTIKKLDNNMCKNCGSTENLNAHHIMPKGEYPELSLDLDNGVTLCEDCHSEVHGYEIY